MEAKTITNYWSHMRFSLAADPTKYVHLLLPIEPCDPGNHTPPKWHALIPKSHIVFQSDWVIPYPSNDQGFSNSMLRSCNLIVDDLKDMAQLIKMIRDYCDRFNNSGNVVLLASDDEFREWLSSSGGRHVHWVVPDIRRFIWERYLLIMEVVSVYDPEKPDQA